jgi:hypothetical protein
MGTLHNLTNPRYTVVHIEDSGWIVTHHTDYHLDRCKIVANNLQQAFTNQNKPWQVKVLERTEKGYRVAYVVKP